MNENFSPSPLPSFKRRIVSRRIAQDTKRKAVATKPPVLLQAHSFKRRLFLPPDF